MRYWLVFVFVLVSLVLVSCIVPTPTLTPMPTATLPPLPTVTLSPLPTPTYPPSPLPPSPHPSPIPPPPYVPPWLKFDFSGGIQMDFSIAGISIALLIVGIVEAAKAFGVTGKGSMALAMGLGVFFVGLAQALTQGVIPPVAAPWVELVVTALAGGLAAMGYYDFARRLRNGV